MKSINKLEIVKIRERTEEYDSILKSSQCVSRLASVAIWAQGEPPQEEFWVILLNTKNRVIGISMIARGNGNECHVSPREVFMPALLCGAMAVIIVHNHPSGDPSPSSEDRLLTIRMCEAGRLLGIKVIDHVIRGGEKHYSFRDEGILT